MLAVTPRRKGSGHGRLASRNERWAYPRERPPELVPCPHYHPHGGDLESTLLGPCRVQRAEDAGWPRKSSCHSHMAAHRLCSRHLPGALASPGGCCPSDLLRGVADGTVPGPTRRLTSHTVVHIAGTRSADWAQRRAQKQVPRPVAVKAVCRQRGVQRAAALGETTVGTTVDRGSNPLASMRTGSPLGASDAQSDASHPHRRGNLSAVTQPKGV